VTRPNVSVILPFLGSEIEALEALERLAHLEVGPDDELILADNTPDGTALRVNRSTVTVVDASDTRSASHARNVGARSASGDWLLFVDSDCVLPKDIIELYFAAPVDSGCGIMAGEIVGDPSQSSLLAAWARSRRGRWASHHLNSGPYPGGITANLLVRRRVWDELGGFRIGGGGDLDLSWRAQAAGWSMAYRPEVVVVHRDRESLSELLQQAFSYGSHGRLLCALHGTSVERARLLRPLARSVGGIAKWSFRREWRKAAFSAIDCVWAITYWLGDLSFGRGARRAD
jgi:GT2 family glycosyltransferase